jgi:hypothetical protein
MTTPFYVLECDGRYAEINPALQTWRLSALARYATRFPSRADAEQAIPHVLTDCGDVWHVTANSVRILEQEAR